MARKFEFSKGESVRIKVGAFRAFVGKVSEIHTDNATLTVIVEIFGRPQAVQLSFFDVEKLNEDGATP